MQKSNICKLEYDNFFTSDLVDYRTFFSQSKGKEYVYGILEKIISVDTNTSPIYRDRIKGSVSRQVRPMLLYIVRKLSL